MLTVWTGRSRRLWPQVLEDIGQALSQGAQRLFLITPDQYTLQAELELIEQLQLPGLLQIEVLSPSRLLTRVFSLAGSPQRVRIDARGRAMVLADVLRQSAGDLRYYSSMADWRGFATRLAEDIASQKSANVTPEALLALAEQFGPEDPLHGKLHDIGLLFARYEQRLAGAFLDGEDAQAALLERLPQSGLLEGARIWIYGFDLITQQFLQQLAVMARGAEQVLLALTWERGSAPDGLTFAPTRDTLQRLSRYFHRESLLWEQVHIDAPLDAPPEIQYLEANLFAFGSSPYEGPTQALHLSISANPYDEVMRAAGQMLAYARNGMPFDEMAVVLGDAEGYAGAIETGFARSGIPYHLVRAQPVNAHPLVRAWLAALRCVTRRWRMEDALDWLKGGFCGLAPEEAELLENCAIENGLRGPKWKRPLEDISLEALRQRFVAPLEALQTRLARARNTTQSLSAVYGLLEDVDAYGTLEAWQRSLAARGMLEAAAECAQAWRIAMETLDQLHALLHGSRIPMAAVAQVVEAGFAAANLDTVPASPGMVQAGQLGHVKLGGNCRVLFLLGLHDGIMHTQSTSLISEKEAGQIAERTHEDASFGLTGDALSQLMQINLLDTLAAPTEALYISHASTSAQGEAQRPAAVLRQLRQLFHDLPEEGSALEAVPTWHAPGAALDAIGSAMRRAATGEAPMTGEEVSVAAWLLHAPQTRDIMRRMVRALEPPAHAARLEQRAADALYAHTRTSISRLESFASCPFRHFVRYGLTPQLRRPFEVARDETGIFYHRAMEGYAKAALQHPNWPEIGRAENDSLVDAVLDTLRAEWENTPLGENAMLRATGDAFCRVVRRVAWTYAGQMRRGSFRTGIIEARFGPGEALPPIALLLPDGQKRWLEGRIDRIDFFESENETWLRVVDYKSGNTTLDLSRVYGGLQLQLLLYLAAALASYPGVSAAGAFYARLDDPLIATDSRDVAEIEQKIAKDLRLRGLVLSDLRVVQAMDDGDALLRQDGSLRKAPELVQEEELGALMRHAYAMATEMASQIAQGEIAVRPATMDSWRACAWCDYASICGFDASLPQADTRPIEKLDRETLMQRLAEDEA